MKRLGKTWEQITAFDNLLLAYRKARKGKRNRHSVANFAADLEQELFRLHDELCSGDYQHGHYREFEIYERKARVISAAPFRDRVVHHALMNVVEPELDKRMIYDSYACRKGKGVHKAVDRYQQWSGQYAYVLKLDISRYFRSIDQSILKTQLRRYLKDTRTLTLCDQIIESANTRPSAIEGKGLPIGNLTSQVFANLYLNQIDHWLTTQPVKYLRYVDDLFILGNSKPMLWQIKDELLLRLAEIKLKVAPWKISLQRCSEKVDVLGYQVTPDQRWLRNENGYRAQRRLKQLQQNYAYNRIDLDDVRASLHSWIGHAQHADTEKLREHLLTDCVFQRAV